MRSMSFKYINTFLKQEYIYAQDSKLLFSPDSVDPRFKELFDEFFVLMDSPDLLAFHEILRVQMKELKGLQETFNVLDSYNAQKD